MSFKLEIVYVYLASRGSASGPAGGLPHHPDYTADPTKFPIMQGFTALQNYFKLSIGSIGTNSTILKLSCHVRHEIVGGGF